MSGGGHGIDITGDSATVDNKGGMTVTDPDSIGIQIDGDKAVVNNDGDNAISNGGTGTQVNGDEATVNNNSSTTVDGKDSTGTEINGDKAIVNNDGDSTILMAAPKPLRVMMRRPTTVAIPPLTDRVRPELKSRVTTRW